MNPNKALWEKGDFTRIAASDPALWQQILGANSGAVADLLRGERLRGVRPLDEDRVLHGDRRARREEVVGARFERGDFFVPEMLIAGRAMAGGQPTPRILEQDIDERSPKVHALLEEPHQGTWRITVRNRHRFEALLEVVRDLNGKEANAATTKGNSKRATTSADRCRRTAAERPSAK